MLRKCLTESQELFLTESQEQVHIIILVDKLSHGILGRTLRRISEGNSVGCRILKEISEFPKNLMEEHLNKFLTITHEEIPKILPLDIFLKEFK